MSRRRREQFEGAPQSQPPDPSQQQQQQRQQVLLHQQHQQHQQHIAQQQQQQQQQQHVTQQLHHIQHQQQQQEQQYFIPLSAPPVHPPPPPPGPPLLAQGPPPVVPLTAQSPEPLRLLSVLDSLKPLGFTSISDFLVHLFTSEDPAVRRRVSLFYTHGGIKSLLEIFMASKRARENGGDEIAVAWAGGVFKDEFDLGLVKGGINVDVRANSTESRGRTTGEILKEGLENFDLVKVQRQCERKAPLLWRLLETLSSSDRERVEVKVAPQPSDEQPQPPASKRRKMDPVPGTVGVSSANPPLTVTIMLLLLASSQVRNKFQKWLGLYLYAQGVRKGPLNSLRTLGVGSEGKVIGDNVLRVIGDDTKKKLRAELGGSDQTQVRGPGAPRINSRSTKRKSLLTAEAIVLEPAQSNPDPLHGKRPFVISQATYHPSPKDHLRADNFAPCATIPFIIRLPVETPVLTKGMIKTSSVYRKEKYFPTVLTPAVPVAKDPPSFGSNSAGSNSGVAAFYGYPFSNSAYSTTPGYDAPTLAPNGDFYYAPATPSASSGPTWPGNANPGATGSANNGTRLLLADEEGKAYWKNQARRSVWRAMKRMWPKVGEIITEDEVCELITNPVAPPETELDIKNVVSQVSEEDLFPMPSMKRVNPKKPEEQMAVLELVSEYLGFDTKHLKGPNAGDRLWIWAGNLETIQGLKSARHAAPPDSVLHNIHPVLQLFDIRQSFLLELLKQHYGKPNDKDLTSLCHHMQIMNRKFLIFGFSVTGQYAEGLLLHSLESHLIDSILSVTKIRESGPKTKQEVLDIITKVYETYLDPETVKAYQAVTEADNRDEVFENHMLLMQHSIVYFSLLECIAAASTDNLLHILAWIATAFQGLTSARSTKMARELLDLVSGLQGEWSSEIRAAVLGSMIIPKPAGAPYPVLSSHPAAAKVAGEYHEVDFAMKQLLRQTKTVFDLRDNPKYDFFREVATPNIRTISKVVRNAEEALGTAPRTANQWKSPAENVDPDKEIPKLVKELREGRVGEWVAGRKASVKVEHLLANGEGKIRGAGFLEEFCRRGDRAVVDGEDAADETEQLEGEKEWRRRNLFFAPDFGFDWGL